MKRFILALACTAAVASTAVRADLQVGPQTSPQPATSEPHHKRVLYTNDVRVFDVVVPPGQSTGAYSYTHSFVTIPIGSGAVMVRDAGSVPGVDNTTTADYHAIEVENMRDDGKWLTSAPIMAPGTSVITQSPQFIVYDVKLAADQMTRHAHAWSTVGVLVSGATEHGGFPGEAPSRLAAGQWLTLPRAQAHTLTAIGGEAHVIEVEAR